MRRFILPFGVAFFIYVTALSFRQCPSPIPLLFGCGTIIFIVAIFLYDD